MEWSPLHEKKFRNLEIQKNPLSYGSPIESSPLYNSMRLPALFVAVHRLASSLHLFHSFSMSYLSTGYVSATELYLGSDVDRGSYCRWISYLAEVKV